MCAFVCQLVNHISFRTDKTRWLEAFSPPKKSAEIEGEAVYDEWGIVAMPNLLSCPDSDPAYLGHFANDGIHLPPLTEADLARYVLESNERANAMHKNIANNATLYWYPNIH